LTSSIRGAFERTKRARHSRTSFRVPSCARAARLSLSHTPHTPPTPTHPCSAIASHLESGSFSLEDLLREDDFIQEAQGQTPALVSFLASPRGLHRLVYYLAAPQRHTDEDRAFRFPYMAAEALCCNVSPILDALTARTEAGRDHLRLLVSLVAPDLRRRVHGGDDGDAHYGLDTSHEVPAGGPDPFLPAAPTVPPSPAPPPLYGLPRVPLPPTPVRPFLAGYVAKVLTMLVRKRPTALTRFLDRTPGVARGLVERCDNAALAQLLVSLLTLLPWDGPSTGMGTMRLSRADAPGESIPSLLLATISSAVEAAGRAAGGAQGGVGEAAGAPPSHVLASRAAHAADVIASVLHAARSDAPHAKYGVEGYNAERLDRVRKGPSGLIGATSAGGGGDAGGLGGSGARRASAGGPPLPDAGDPLATGNIQLDPTYHEADAAPADRAALRLLKALRDGPLADTVVALAVRAAQVLAAFQARVARGGIGGAVVSGAAQTACDAAFRVLAAVSDACALGWRHQSVLGFGVGSDGTGTTGPCPRLLAALGSATAAAATAATPAPLAVLAGYLSSLSAGATETVNAVLAAASPSALPGGGGRSRRGGRGGSDENEDDEDDEDDEEGVAAQATPGGKAPLRDADVTPGVAPVPSYRLTPALGISGLSLARALAAVTRCGWPQVAGSAVRAGVFPALLDALTAFPWHSILHKVVCDAVVDAVRSGPEPLQKGLLFEARLLTRVVAGLKLGGLPGTMSAYGRRTGRIGYAGHLVAMANAVIASNAAGTLAPSAASLVASHSDWRALTAAELAVANIAHGILIGGMAPDTKASGNVGASADATGAPRAAVDEVAVLERKEDDEDRLSGGSGGSSSDEEDGGDERGGSSWGASARARRAGDSDDEGEGEGEADGRGAAARPAEQPTSAAAPTVVVGSDAVEEDDADSDWGRAARAGPSAAASGAFVDDDFDFARAGAAASVPPAPAHPAPAAFAFADDDFAFASSAASATAAGPEPAAAAAALEEGFGFDDPFPSSATVSPAPAAAAAAAGGDDFDAFGGALDGAANEGNRAISPASSEDRVEREKGGVELVDEEKDEMTTGGGDAFVALDDNADDGPDEGDAGWTGDFAPSLSPPLPATEVVSANGSGGHPAPSSSAGGFDFGAADTAGFATSLSSSPAPSSSASSVILPGNGQLGGNGGGEESSSLRSSPEQGGVSDPFAGASGAAAADVSQLSADEEDGDARSSAHDVSETGQLDKAASPDPAFGDFGGFEAAAAADPAFAAFASPTAVGDPAFDAGFGVGGWAATAEPAPQEEGAKPSAGPAPAATFDGW
jgi:hypothetical protein